MTRVGLIGAAGHVGRAVLRYLHEDPKIQILAAGRSRAKIERTLSSSNYEKVEIDEFDLFNDDRLVQFCTNVDIVVNCAGPSGMVLDRVVVAAMRAGRPVIDPGGYDPVLEKLKNLEKNHKPTDPPVIVGAGLLPGLSGLYPRLIADSDEETPPERIDVFYAGTDMWGESSAWDIVQSVGDFGNKKSPSFYRRGEEVSVPFWQAFRTMELPTPIGRSRGFLVYTKELERLAQTLNIEEVRCHGINTGRWSGLILSLVKLAGLCRTENQIQRSARWLLWAAQKDKRHGQEACFAIDCAATWLDGRVRHGRIIVSDTYNATGAVIACLIRILIDNNMSIPNCTPAIGMMHELFDAAEFLAAFRMTDCILMEEIQP